MNLKDPDFSRNYSDEVTVEQTSSTASQSYNMLLNSSSEPQAPTKGDQKDIEKLLFGALNSKKLPLKQSNSNLVHKNIATQF